MRFEPDFTDLSCKMTYGAPPIEMELDDRCFMSCGQRVRHGAGQPGGRGAEPEESASDVCDLVVSSSTVHKLPS